MVVLDGHVINFRYLNAFVVYPFPVSEVDVGLFISLTPLGTEQVNESKAYYEARYNITLDTKATHLVDRSTE